MRLSEPIANSHSSVAYAKTRRYARQRASFIEWAIFPAGFASAMAAGLNSSGARDICLRMRSSVLDVALGFLREVEISEMTKSFKMVTLEALCEDDHLVVRHVHRRSGASLPCHNQAVSRASV